jgi:uncharacterized membrane protein YGL010W
MAASDNPMTETEAVNASQHWLDVYAVGHTHPTNRVLHWICAPLLTVSFIGLLSCMPVPPELARLSPIVNWGTLFLMAAVVYYFIMSITLALGTLPFVVAILAALAWFERSQAPLLPLSATGLLIATIGQYLGHRIEGGGATLMRDLLYIAIAPLWALAALYRKLGIPY